MSKSNLSIGMLSLAPAVVLVGLAACGEAPTSARQLAGQGPSLATAVAERPTYDAVFTGEIDASGRPIYTLDEVCDIFIGEDPVVAGDPETPTKYQHQRVVNVPEGAIVRLVGNAGMQASGSRTFTCDASDPDNPTQPVVDPVTDHAAKGDGPKIATGGVTLDLNGYSITASPSATDLNPLYDNLGIVVTGDNVTVTNTVVPDASGAGVSRISRFGHNIDVEAEVSPTVRGMRVDADGDPATIGWIYNLETEGAMGVRLSGSALVEQVKSVNLDPVEGQGFEIRRCNAGSLSVIRDSHFEGGLEGAFIRECSGVTFENNYVSGHGGTGIATRQAVSTLARPIVIRGNTVEGNAEYGILWGRDSRSNNGSLVISGNRMSTYGLCGVAISRRNTTFGPYTLATLAAANTFDRATSQVCRLND